MKPNYAVILAFSASAVACGTGGSERTGVSQQALSVLLPLQGCDEVESFVRDRLVADVNAYVDSALANIDKDPYGGCYYADAVPAFGGSAGSVDDVPTESAGATETSTTNNQVAGVDEADFVKNDNQYLYVVANGAFRILQAWPAAESRAIAEVPIDGDPRKLFVDGDRALVYVAVPQTSSNDAMPFYGYAGGSCTYGYDCVPSGDGTRTKILVFDISNRAAPTKIREIDLSGSLLEARRVGDAVHTVVVDSPSFVAGLESYPSNVPACANSLAQRAEIKAAWEALRKKNLALIAEADVLSTLPTITENGQPAVAACTGYYRPSLAEGHALTTVLSLDMIAAGAPTAATVVSDPGIVYASENALYMSVPHTRSLWGGWYAGMDSEDYASLVHKFRIGGTPSLTGYQASGVVKGRVLNQFSLDEFAGHLRVATTSGQVPDDKVHSTMSILEQQGNALVLTGKVDNIAPHEDIRSVRFDGSRGFVVTFKKTDPLYAFDLSNPNAPSITGELQIPGFSTYMHMMDADHLLTIGYDADDEGSFAWFSGVRLQIFDVADMKNPTLLHAEVIGTRGSSSEALMNHLAFTYFAPKNLLALPMTICEGGSPGAYGTDMTFSGLLVYNVTPASGFQKLGEVPHSNASSGLGYDSSACWNWWTNASSEVKRSVIMDDFVYSISERRVKVNALANLSSDLAEVSLE